MELRAFTIFLWGFERRPEFRASLLPGWGARCNFLRILERLVVWRPCKSKSGNFFDPRGITRSFFPFKSTWCSSRYTSHGKKVLKSNINPNFGGNWQDSPNFYCLWGWLTHFFPCPSPGQKRRLPICEKSLWSLSQQFLDWTSLDIHRKRWRMKSEFQLCSYIHILYVYYTCIHTHMYIYVYIYICIHS